MSVPTASPVNQWQSCHWSRRQSTRTSGVLVLFTSLPQSVVFPQSCSCSFLLLLPALLGTSPWCRDWRELFHCVISGNSCNHSLSEQHSIRLSTLPLVETEVCCLRNFKDSSKRRILILLFVPQLLFWSWHHLVCTVQIPVNLESPSTTAHPATV